jgi:hypothetical protein
LTTRYKYLWLVPTLALAACGDSTGGGTTPPPTGDVGADVVKDTGSDITTMDSGDDVITPVDNGPDVIKQPDVEVPDAGDDVVTPTDTADDVVTPTDAGDDVVTPTDTADDVVTPTDTADDAAADAVTPTDTAVDTGPVCPTGQSACGTACVDLNTSAANCGTCGNACGAGTECRGASCVPVCRTGESLCGTPATCTATLSDINNCGGCGTVCPSGQMCVSGVCSLVCTAPQIVCTAASGARTCVDVASDNGNCGACGNACAMGQSCVAGACIVVCPTGQTACGSACFDLASSNANCGSCGTACATGETCAMGRCQRTCAAGETLCGTACVNTTSDAANCGRCGTVCSTGQSCAAGACACPTGQTLCGTGAAATCLDLSNNTLNCGMCGRACTAAQNCTAGACVTTAPVNDLPAGAVVINLAAPSQTITGATVGATNQSGCLSGGDVYYRFTLTAREVVYADTYGTMYDTGLAFAPASGTGIIAGTCVDDITTCGATRIFQAQVARQLDPGTYYLVVSGFGSATGPFTLRFQHLPVGNGAVTQLADPTAGVQTLTGTTTGTGVLTQSCGVGATGPETTYWYTTCPNFTALNYTASTCGAATWDTVLEQRSAARTPLAVCNDDACSTQSTVSGTLAAGAGLHALYVDGYSGASGAYTLSLRYGSCTTGQTLCGTTCVDLQTSATNCGTCGTACGTGQVCTAGRCGCPTGQLLCGGVCVNAQTSVTNCGACGRTCLAGQSCTAGACVCPTGTNVCGTACVNLQTSATNCGTCGTTCPSGAACTAGACVCPAGQTACGATCRTLATDNANCGACGRACTTGNTCQGSVCRPANDVRTNATAITLPASGAEATVAGTTVGATADGPTDCGGAVPNVWYSVTLTATEVLYADTAGSSYDTRLSIVNSAGATVANTCNDDASCTTGGFTGGTQSRTYALLTAGTYFINVGGYLASSTGAFTLHVQHIRRAIGSFFYDAQLTGNTTTATSLVGTGVRAPMCTIGPSGEDVRWVVSCGATTTPSLFSLCRGDGGSFARRVGTTNYDPVLSIVGGATGTEVQCNDDGPAASNCTGTGTGADTLNFGSRISASLTRGISAVIVDERSNPNGLRYTLRYNVQ